MKLTEQMKTGDVLSFAEDKEQWQVVWVDEYHAELKLVALIPTFEQKLPSR